jgi:hypothetical protein
MDKDIYMHISTYSIYIILKLRGLKSNRLNLKTQQTSIEDFIPNHLQLGINNNNISFNGFNPQDVVPILNK